MQKCVDAAGTSKPDGSNLSQDFELSDVSIKADTLLLDSAVTANIDEALAGGKL